MIRFKESELKKTSEEYWILHSRCGGGEEIKDQSFQDKAYDLSEQLGYTRAINDVYALLSARLDSDTLLEILALAAKK